MSDDSANKLNKMMQKIEQAFNNRLKPTDYQDSLLGQSNAV